MEYSQDDEADEDDSEQKQGELPIEDKQNILQKLSQGEEQPNQNTYPEYQTDNYNENQMQMYENDVNFLQTKTPSYDDNYEYDQDQFELEDPLQQI